MSGALRLGFERRLPVQVLASVLVMLAVLLAVSTFTLAVRADLSRRWVLW